jgi:MinD-like ATPase involved in chromosome partitioning or flagellar assembly
VVGDCTTTTCVALAATWPIDDVVVVEADPGGGSLSAWLDTPASPTLGTLAATARSHTMPDGTLRAVTSMTHHSESGVRFLASPARAVAARRAIEEAATLAFPAIARSPDMIALADVGRPSAADQPAAIVSMAAAMILVHRQERASAAAEAVRLERLVEIVERLVPTGIPSTLAIIGDAPFDPIEIVDFVEESVPGALTTSFDLADDPLSAAVLAGRHGVSASRLRRLPLLRSAGSAAGRMRRVLEATIETTGVVTTP